MKIKELISLDSTNLLKLYMENKGVKNITQQELDTFFDVYSSTNYELFATDLKDGLLYSVDSDLASNQDFELTEGEGVDLFDEPQLLLSSVTQYFFEQCLALHNCKNDMDESSYKIEWERHFKTYNLLLDFESKIEESFKKYKYTTELGIFTYYDRDGELRSSKNVFDSEIECFNHAYKIIDNFLLVSKQSDLKDLTGNYNLSDDFEFERFLLEFRDLTSISIWCKGTFLNINTRVEVIPEIYCVTMHKVEQGVYSDSVEVFHFNSKEKALNKFNEIVDPYKEKYPAHDLGKADNVYESNYKDCMYYELYIDDDFSLECSLDLVEIQ